MGLWKEAIHLANWTLGALSDGIFGPKPKNEVVQKQPEESKPEANQGKNPLTDSAVNYRTPSNPGTRRYLKEHFRKSR